jgi:ABC-type polysaccharide/polyol phosphate transport system ATPase subunit
MTSREIKDQFDNIVDFAELWEFIDTPVKRYSSGMYARLGFAVAVHSDPEVLLVDEALSVGDAFFEEKCVEKMHEFQHRGTTIVVVSHSLTLISSFCERAIWMEHGGVVAEGPSPDVVRRYTETVPHPAEIGV